MKSLNMRVAGVVACLMFAVAVQAQVPSRQSATASATTSDARPAQSETIIPRLVKFGGTLLDAQEHPLVGPVGVTFSLYAQQTGGAALWMETQNVKPDANGAYTVLLGAASANGLPTELFVSGEARWLGIQVGQQPEHERVLLVSVPYAVKAGDAETLGGLPPSAFVTTGAPASTGHSTGASSLASSQAQTTPKKASTPQPATPCTSVTSDGAATVNSITMFTTPCNVESSVLTQVSGNLGIGTATPAVALDVVGNNAGLRLSGTGTHQVTVTGASSGRLGQDATGFFFSSDTNGKVVKFLTNNGTLNEWMRITSAGNVGIRTQTPAANLDVNGSLHATAGSFTSLSAVAGSFISGATTITSSTNGTNGVGVSSVASASAAGSAGTGVFGQTQGTNGIGIWGQATDITGLDGTGSPAESDAVHGDAAGPYSVGVFGNATCDPTTSCPADSSAASVSKGGTGALGVSASPWGSGMLALATWPPNNCGTPNNPTCDPQSGGPIGLFAQAKSVQGAGVLGSASSFLAANNTAVSPPGPPIAQGGPVGAIGSSRSPNGVGVFGVATFPPVGCGTTLPKCNPNLTPIGVAGVYGAVRRTAGAGVYGESDTLLATAGTFNNTAGKLNNPPTNDCLMAGTPAGSGCNVFIAQANGTNVFRVSGDGHTHAAAYDIGGADFAESVAISGARAKYEPGDVLVIDTRGKRRLAKAQEPYSALVAGVVSTKPGVLASLHSTVDMAGEAELQKEVPLAVIGIVPCKVTAENGPIAPGDLLVTSSTPGHAMKGTDRRRMLGAVVGKALEPLQHGTGIIEVLVTLQ